MTGLRRAIAALGLLASAGCVTASERSASCAIADGDRLWLVGALDNWRASARADLHIDPHPLPDVVTLDAHCTYLLKTGRTDRMTSREHGGQPVLPDGKPVPLGPVSFATGAKDGYFVMSLPTVWHAAGVKSGLGVEGLMDGVLLHEIMHTRQAELAGPQLDTLARANGIGEDDLTDNIVQERFGEDPTYRAAYERERDLLFAAAGAASDAQARSLAREALAALRARRARFFADENAFYEAFDDIFLTMEGMGQWLAYRHYVSPRGGAIDPTTALREVRRDGSQWTQDEGLALILVVDRLLPDWQARAFRDPDWRAEALLAAATGDSQ
ncbi:hypothetical protein [Erythrobacter mangrovi]|uniref:Uncharacterized protein n=1 Tax=Erythrobacter mangrovi TaxID=2739433 RepID=A0A7D4B7B7_9SPHN|nr:hypothetical protein [Erythrobacter mangrovi]QKG71023.1 hypothetical protein HQR01_06350 [Erythrobacter mangrovi]